MKVKKKSYPHHLEKMMEGIYLSVIKDLDKRMRARIIASYESNIKVDASFNDGIKEIIDDATGYLKSIYMSHMIEQVTKKIAKWSQDQVYGMLNKLKDMPSTRDFAELAVKYAMDDPLVEAFSADYVQKNIELVDALGKEYIDGVAQAAQDTFINGGSMAELTETMSGFTAGSMEKAAFWARDQVGDAYASFTETMHKKAGFPNYIWHTVGDSRVRGMKKSDQTSHVILNNRVFSWERGAAYTGQISKPGGKHPGQDYNCVTPKTQILFDSDVKRCYRHFFKGELTHIVTATGIILDVTPNHPILTTSGWKAAKDINFGDYLIKISDKAVNICKEDVHYGIGMAEEVFDFFKLRFPVKRVCGFTSQFHGDGSDQEVDVITIDGGLMDKFNFKFFKGVFKFVLSMTNKMWPWIIKTTYGSFPDFFNRMFSSGASASRGLGNFFYFIRGHFGKSDTAGLRSVAGNDAMRYESFTDRRAGYFIFPRTFKLAHAGNIILNKRFLIDKFEVARVTSVDRIHYDGLVYNFETSDGIYYTNLLSSHNCRCNAEGTFDKAEDE